MSDELPPIKFGNVSATPVNTANARMSMLLWGSAGCGKTTLAATAPGDLLWLNFDPDGTAAIAGRPGIRVLDFAPSPNSIVTSFKLENPGNIEGILANHPEIKTVVVDSVTSFGEKALAHGVIDAKTSIEEPQFAGYGRKNIWTRYMVINLLKATAKYQRHIIFICHEDTPQRDPKGNVLFITLMLGSSLSEEVPLQISEVWWLQDLGKDGRRIAIRPCRMRKPMKTRMFVTDSEPEFPWKFNPTTWKGDTIEDWWNKWKEADHAKIALPT